MRSEVQVLLDPPRFLFAKNEFGSAFGKAEWHERHSVEGEVNDTKSPRMAIECRSRDIPSQCLDAHDHFAERNGALAQLGERLICIQEVSGSIPLGSTKISASPEFLVVWMQGKQERAFEHSLEC